MSTIDVTALALENIKRLQREYESEDSGLRFGLSGGGCSGYKYVLEFGDFHAFGASNVIPNHANISGTFRSLDQKFRSEVHELILKEAKLIDLNYKSNCVVKIKMLQKSLYKCYFIYHV